jgi:hypothetical protein
MTASRLAGTVDRVNGGVCRISLNGTFLPGMSPDRWLSVHATSAWLEVPGCEEDAAGISLRLGLRGWCAEAEASGRREARLEQGQIDRCRRRRGWCRRLLCNKICTRRLDTLSFIDGMPTAFGWACAPREDMSTQSGGHATRRKCHPAEMPPGGTRSEDRVPDRVRSLPTFSSLRRSWRRSLSAWPSR